MAKIEGFKISNFKKGENRPKVVVNIESKQKYKYIDLTKKDEVLNKEGSNISDFIIASAKFVSTTNNNELTEAADFIQKYIKNYGLITINIKPELYDTRTIEKYISDYIHNPGHKAYIKNALDIYVSYLFKKSHPGEIETMVQDIRNIPGVRLD